MNTGSSGIKMLLLSIILSLQQQNVFCQAHYLDSYPGIPIIAHTNRTASEITPDNLQGMKELGIMGFYATDLSAASYYTITDSGLKVFPFQLSGNNWIVYYTDAVYTKWEAEGKGDGSNGDMELKHQNIIGELFNEGDTSGIKTFNSTPGKLLYGPWYYQYKYYKQLALDPINSPIEYTANFHLKINERNPGSQLPLNYAESIVCTIIVAVTHPVRVNKDSTLFSRELKVKDFLPPDGTGWNSWKDFTIDYNLSTVKDKSEEILKEGFINDDIDTIYTTNWMQYKIEWAGSTFLDLYVDYVEISDKKARDLTTDIGVANQIINLVNQYTDTSKVLGWFGLNEPASIDNYEPFRVVDSLINANSNNLHLYTTFTTGWGGVYGMPWPDAFESNGGVYIGSEFIKRSKLPYLSLNTYNYNYPITPGMSPNFYLENIEYVTKENLHKLDSLGIPISHSTQSGRFYNFNSSCINEFKGSINPTSEQMLYHINLGLLYGMIELTCDPLFTLYNREAHRPCPDSLYRSGLINYSDNTLTPLGLTWKNKVAPRMSGLLGKTSRLLDPSSQHLLINPSVSSDLNINTIKKIKLDYGNVTEAMPSYLDLGFFSKEGFEPNRYFMIINRYYSDSLLNKFKIEFRNLSGFYNWSLMNYVDSSHTTIIANETGFVTSPQFQINRGDAILLSLFPVAEFGGKLLVSENVGNGMTLTDDMTIENGATLSVYGNYHAKANIIVKNGGRINNYENGKIIFDQGKKLIIEGTALINGTAINNLTLEFSSATSEGIVVKPGGALYLSYCDVKNAQIGVKAEVGSGQINISNVNFTNCSNTGIALLGLQGDESQIPPPPTVYKCNITGSLTSISAANYNEILIKENTINNSNIGIALSSITSAFVQSNIILGNSIGNNDGILLASCGGYLSAIQYRITLMVFVLVIHHLILAIILFGTINFTVYTLEKDQYQI